MKKDMSIASQISSGITVGGSPTKIMSKTTPRSSQMARRADIPASSPSKISPPKK